MTKRNLFLILFLMIAVVVPASQVEEVAVKSTAMNRDVNVVVIIPEKAVGSCAQECPVVYLLHGYGGDSRTWLAIKPDLPKIADEKGIIFVCPDGENSWYWDSPLNRNSLFETFISSELPVYIDTRYNTINHRTGRAITGLSMGGHGALWNAIRHSEVFGAAGSTSGGVDIRPFPENWQMAKQLGAYKGNEQRWDEYTVINLVDQLPGKDLKLVIDCGFDDFFLEVNKRLHDKLLSLGVEHDFILRPGAHKNEYWNNSIEYQIHFFEKYFRKVTVFSLLGI